MVQVLSKYSIILLSLSLFSACSSLYDRVMQKADESRRLGEYEDAYIAYVVALEQNPSSKEAAEMLELVRPLAALENIGKAYAHMAENDLYAAIPRVQKAANIDPQHPDLAPLIKKFKQAAILQIDQDRDRGFWDSGIHLSASIAQGVLPLSAHFSALLESLKSEWADTLLKDAKAYEDAGLFALAYVVYAHIHQLQPNQSILLLAENMAVHAEREISYKLAITGNKRDANVLNVIDSLRNAKAPAGTLQLLFGGAQDDDISANVRVSIDRPIFDTKRSYTTETASYISDYEMRRNPDAVKIDNELNAAMVKEQKLAAQLSTQRSEVNKFRRIAEDSPDNASLQHRLDQAIEDENSLKQEGRSQAKRVQVLRDKLAGTPKMIEVPIYSDYTYQVETITRSVSSRIRYQIEHTDGLKTSEGWVNMNWKAWDTAWNAHPIIGLGAKRPSILSDSELVSKMTQGHGPEFMAAIEKEFAAWRMRFYDGSRNAQTLEEKANFAIQYFWSSPSATDLSVLNSVYATFRIQAQHYLPKN